MYKKKTNASTERTNQDGMKKKKTLKRNCAVCGKNMLIGITDGRRHYSSGHYFGKIRIPIKGTGKYQRVGRSTLLGGVDVVKWTGKEKEVEYWECNHCYREY